MPCAWLQIYTKRKGQKARSKKRAGCSKVVLDEKPKDADTKASEATTSTTKSAAAPATLSSVRVDIGPPGTASAGGSSSPKVTPKLDMDRSREGGSGESPSKEGKELSDLSDRIKDFFTPKVEGPPKGSDLAPRPLDSAGKKAPGLSAEDLAA